MGRLALPLLLLVAAAPAEDDRPSRHADPELQPRINTAIAQGVQYLRSIQQPDGSWAYLSPQRQEDMTAGLTALALYALAASKVPPDDPAIRKGVRWTEHKKALYTSDGAFSTYSASLLVLALTRIDPKDHQTRIHRLAESIANGQLANDMWTYQLGSSRETRGKEKRERLGPIGPGDNSNSQFAALALWAAQAIAGYEVPPRTWERIQRFYARTQLPEGGWGYGPGPSPCTGSMTSAGLCSYVYATAGLLGGVRALPAARADPVAQRGVAALMTVPRPGNYRNYYFVYALERAGTVMAIPEEDWYVQGARALVGQQEEGGRWGGVAPGTTHGGAYETSLALLFLSQATRAAITRGGDPDGGRIITVFPGHVGPAQLEEALLYYMTAPAAERRTLGPRFAEARTATVGFLIGKLRASDRDARAAAYELLGLLVEKRFLFEPDAKPEDRDVMLAPIEAFWQEQRSRIAWDEAKGRFTEG